MCLASDVLLLYNQPADQNFLHSFGCMHVIASPPITENELYLKLFITNGGGW